MLSKEDNELLSRVGRGTPMGELLRQYWLPFLLASELSEPDGRPQRVRLLGEDLIAFRDSEGHVGLLGDHCAHRGASLFFGRNEEGGLRCVYHGWKYDVNGNCVDMPNEPEERGSGMPDPYKPDPHLYQPGSVGARRASPSFRDKIRHLAYPCRELNGVIWTYMGPRGEPPDFPELEWALAPESQRRISPSVRECNWVQALEGDVDLSHGSFLHSVVRKEDVDAGSQHTDRFTGNLPVYEVLDTDFGVMFGARRLADDESRYHWRVGQFLMPIVVLIPPTGERMETNGGHAWIPMDDDNTLVWSFSWHPSRSLTRGEENGGRSAPGRDPAAQAQLGGQPQYLPATSTPAGAWYYKGNRSNDYLLDYEAQRSARFSGLPSVPLQDQAMCESMGTIVDRSVEHLGATDAVVIRMRRRLINAAKALRETGLAPPGVDSAAAYRVRAASGTLLKDESWVDAAKQWTAAQPGSPVVSVKFPLRGLGRSNT